MIVKRTIVHGRNMSKGGEVIFVGSVDPWMVNGVN